MTKTVYFLVLAVWIVSPFVSSAQGASKETVTSYDWATKCALMKLPGESKAARKQGCYGHSYAKVETAMLKDHRKAFDSLKKGENPFAKEPVSQRGYRCVLLDQKRNEFIERQTTAQKLGSDDTEIGLAFLERAARLFGCSTLEVQNHLQRLQAEVLKK